MHSGLTDSPLGRLAIRSARLVFVGDLLQKISGPLLAVILTQFLTPAEFGILGVANLVLAFALIFQQGVTDAIIQRRDEDDHVHAGFWISIAIGLILYLLSWILAPVLDRIFNQPGSILVIRILCIQLVLSSLGIVPLALLKRKFEFDKVLVSQFTAALVTMSIAIPMAMLGFGYWAIVVGLLISNLLYVVMIFVLSRYTPRLSFHLTSALNLLYFTRFVVLESFLAWFLVYFDNAIVGAVLGTSALGLYSLAFSITNATIGLPVGALAGVSLTTFSKLQDDREALKSIYMDATKLIAFYAIPAGIALSLLSETFAALFFNQDWRDIGSLMAVLSLYAGFGHIWALNTHVFKSLGRPNIILQIYIPLTLVLIPVFVLSVQQGIMVFTIARSVTVILLGGLLHTVIAVKALGLRWDYLWICCRTPILSSLLLAACLQMLDQLLPDNNLAGFLVLKIFLGFGSYIVGLMIFDKKFANRLLQLYANS